MRFNRYRNGKKGMAIVITLTVCMLLLVYATTLFQQNKDVRLLEYKIKESLRAQFLAKGASQMALLKMRELPTEFYDAVRWHLGWVDENGAQAISTGKDGKQFKDIRKFIPNLKVFTGFAGSSNYLYFYIGFQPAVGNNLLGNVQLLGTPVPKTVGGTATTSDLFYAVNPAAGDSFVGDCIVKEIRLISQHNNNIQDNVEIVAEGSEDSGNEYMSRKGLYTGITNADGRQVTASQYNSVYRKMVDVGYMISK